MVPDATRAPGPAGNAGSPPDPAVSEAAIRSCLVDNAAKLLGKARYYVLRFRLASGPALSDLAKEIFQELARRALEIAPRYRPGQCPAVFWLEGILKNIVRQLRDERCRHPRVYPEQARDDAALDGEDFDRFIRLAGMEQEPPDQEEQLAAQEEWDQLLDALQPQDREILELSIECGMDYDQIAARLGTTRGAARARRCRALKRIRGILPPRRGRR